MAEEKKDPMLPFRVFAHECPLYGGLDGEDYDKANEGENLHQDIDVRCITACNDLIRARDDPANKDHKNNLDKLIAVCGGYRGKECGEAANIYKYLSEITEQEKASEK